MKPGEQSCSKTLEAIQMLDAPSQMWRGVDGEGRGGAVREHPQAEVPAEEEVHAGGVVEISDRR